MFTAASGLDERIITPDELREAEPNMHVGPEVIAALQTDEAVLNPMLLVQGYWRAAQRHGADLHAYTPVVGFDQSAGRITAIRTPTGAISAGEVIVAAGSWTREVALMAGVSLPEYFIHAEAVVTEPIPPLLNGFAYWANALRVPEEARIAIESMSAGWESRGDETLFGGYDFGTVQTVHGNMLFGQMSYINPACSYDVGSQVVTDSAREALRMFPQLNKLRVIRSWRSFAPFTPDHLPLVGRVEAPQNLSIASGYASAITLCDWSGEFMADLVSGAPTDPEAAMFDPMRFPQPIAV